MPTYILDTRSLKELEGVHPILTAVRYARYPVKPVISAVHKPFVDAPHYELPLRQYLET